MENRNQELIDKLNHLIAIAEDGKTGYANAAEDVKDAEMKTLFSKFSHERSAYADKLQEQVKLAGGKPEEGGGPLGAMHRAWMDLKSTFTSGDKDAVINTCTTGEEAAIKEYEEALNGDNDYIKGDTRVLLSQQLDGIKHALNTIKGYRSVPTN